MPVFLLFYDIAWHLLVLPAIVYLLVLSRENPLYRKNIGQRLGGYAKGFEQAVWIHAVSIGELRSAVPLARALRARGERVLITCFTPAGLREAQKTFASDIAANHIRVVWSPFDISWAYHRFLKTFRPKLGLVMEVEIWPRMIFACRGHQMPLFMCNSQYATKSIARDSKWPRLRQKVMRGFAGAFVKSQKQADRFAAVGVQNITVTGEMRFDQPVPSRQLERASEARRRLFPGDRRIVTFASVVAKEEDLFLNVTRDLLNAPLDKRPQIVFVPRAPERFDAIADKLTQESITFASRSDILDDDLGLIDTPAVDLLLGDSLGEMYFYLAMGDLAVVSGGYNPRGSHNIVEPLALGKQVIVGPETWTIEYPAVEAIEAGVVHQVAPNDLGRAIMDIAPPTAAQVTAFLDEHTGAVGKTVQALKDKGLIG